MRRFADFAKGGAAVWVLVTGVVLATGYALDLGDGVTLACEVGITVTGLVCVGLGPRLHRPPSATPWRLVLLSGIGFLCGMLARLATTGRVDPVVLVSDAFLLPAYALLLVALVLLARGHRRPDSHALADGLIIAVGLGTVTIVELMTPTVQISTRPAVISVVQSLYPLIDTVLVLLVLNLAFTTSTRSFSYRALGAGLFGLLLGDALYGYIGAHGRLTGPAWLDVPFLLAFSCFGAAAIHPSMTSIGRETPRLPQPWSRARLAVIVPALLAPSALVLTDPHRPGAHVVLAVGSGVLVVLLLLRAVSAVRGLATVQERLRHQAGHDSLTGLPNRAELLHRVQAELDAGRGGREPLWVLFLDLDGFKLVNDSWGHTTGDRLLVEVGDRLREVIGPHSVARVGGDEFVIAGRMTREDAVETARRVQTRLRETVEVYALDLVVTTSIGMAHEGDDATAEDLLRDADTAMYRAKARGRDGWMIFDDSMRRSVRDRVEIELALRHALPREQLWLAYQPIVDIASEQVVGAEVLLRWLHPERGAISPEVFVPVAEETGMIGELGAWVLREALGQLARWRAAGVVDEAFTVSVNASARQLRDSQLPTALAGLLEEAGVPSSALIVEITESTLLESDAVGGVLAELRRLGVHLSVDDFGTGYSSLTYLNRYPVTGVKVDRSFVDGLGTVAGDEAIVRAVTAMARALGLGVVAEGVETHQQRDLLRKLGVKLGQGWLWGAAVAPDAFAERWGDTPPVHASETAISSSRSSPS